MIPQCASALLISDLHLTPSMPLTAQRFFDFCEKDAPQVQAVFILGDLFEYWVGDDASLHSPFQQEVKRALANLSSKTKTYYIHGNRDFLLGHIFLKKTGMTLLTDPSLVEIAGQQYLLAHGDALCTADMGYQAFRSWVRKPWLQKLFLALPIAWRRAIANHLRSNSHAQYQRNASASYSKNQIKTNVTLEACAATLRSHASDKLIHGHTHLPAHHQESFGEQLWQRWVLSDWDLDHPEGARPRASALLINEQGVRSIDLVKS
ncbi:UDP-2,3-diacylglucosamine diphosphatase [Polynucleobacter wuianus]|uniref:UDP-2,3-diacylglucosamine hydrolase n=1 Tax=Polynucleobacter wuianus TaxID=1743168 RepID=A0A191UF01_9BURK|nr:MULTISPECIES: UDP-2,3-diacylglucosamine diphosphatase [Polynucleobacter]ANI99623.1 UDP-2,3-diacylglucosamine diphosphatase [Polynucleobacter wuianus]MBU3551735.1 UDP-2,3-diacylglucosamine diphosphatase [Polynucleobacter sp. MWH-Post4-6-1]